MRTIVKSTEFETFYSNLPETVQQKIDYALNVITQIKVVHKKLVKYLEGTGFYELRISTENEYRVIIFSIDHENFIEANHVILLNGFMKKTKKDYKKQIQIARTIIKKYM